MSGNGNSRIEEIRHEERQLSAKLKTLTAELNQVRHQAEEARQKLASLEAERLLLERKVVKVKILPDPRTARKNINASDEAIKRLFTNMTQAERDDLLAELRGETVE